MLFWIVLCCQVSVVLHFQYTVKTIFQRYQQASLLKFHAERNVLVIFSFRHCFDRIIKKASGEGNSAHYEEIVYEGYGPSGIAVIVETLTDNRNRTAGEMRHYFDKNKGNMGQSGCVSFLFTRYGEIVIDAEDMDEDKLMEDALEAGAVDFINDEDVYIIRTEPNDLGGVRDDLSAKGYKFVSAEVEYVPSTTVKLTDEEDLKMMGRLLEDGAVVREVVKRKAYFKVA